mmetsp:Transcript_56699/g.104978  ORF Transcript_56699/g.104978 Transcript_56699/m.104978 type:complete len:204 (-) Transcript_56699:7-618(-)
MCKGSAVCGIAAMLAMSMCRSLMLSDLLVDGAGNMLWNGQRICRQRQPPSEGGVLRQAAKVNSGSGARCQAANPSLVARACLLMTLVRLESAAGSMGRTYARWSDAPGDATPRSCLPCKMEDTAEQDAPSTAGPRAPSSSARLSQSLLLRMEISWGQVGHDATGTLVMTKLAILREHPGLPQIEGVPSLRHSSCRGCCVESAM